MEYLHALGYPVPAVDEVSEDGTELVMERIHGPSMVDAIALSRGRSPGRDGRWQTSIRGSTSSASGLSRTFRARQRREHPSSRPASSQRGDRAGRGPVVIDWTNARIGNADVDVALAWVLMSAGEIPGSGADGEGSGARKKLPRTKLLEPVRPQAGDRSGGRGGRVEAEGPEHDHRRGRADAVRRPTSAEPFRIVPGRLPPEQPQRPFVGVLARDVSGAFHVEAVLHD